MRGTQPRGPPPGLLVGTVGGLQAELSAASHTPEFVHRGQHYT